LREEGAKVRWAVVGRKGASTLRFRRYDVDDAWSGFGDKPSYADAQAVAHRLAELYTERDVDRVIVVYNRFVSPLVQHVTEQELLPISEQLLSRDAQEETEERALSGEASASEALTGQAAAVYAVLTNTEPARFTSSST